MAFGEVLSGIQRQGQREFLRLLEGILTLIYRQDMYLQRQMNVDSVVEHEKLCHDVNAFWGPENTLFTYTTSKWDEVSSREISSDSDNDSHQTPLLMGLSQ